MPDLVVDDKKPVRLAARHTEFAFVNLVEQLALVELDGALQIAAELRPAEVEQLQFYPARPGRARRRAMPSRASVPRTGARAAWCSIASSCSPISVSSAAMSRSSAARHASGSPARRNAAAGPNHSASAGTVGVEGNAAARSAAAGNRMSEEPTGQDSSRSGGVGSEVTSSGRWRCLDCGEFAHGTPPAPCPITAACTRPVAESARPAACWSSAPPTAATAADRRSHCRSPACPGSP